MSTSQGSSNGDATRRDSTAQLGVEASTPPHTAHTHQPDRSRSADRHAAHGNEARDERLPYRIPRQPNIPSGEVGSGGIGNGGIAHSGMPEEGRDVPQPREQPSVNSDSGAAAIARMEARTRAKCRSRTEVELGLEAPRCLQYQIYRVCRGRRPRSTRRRIDTSRCMEAWVGSRCSNSRHADMRTRICTCTSCMLK
jgi:hypothetical protein